MGRLILWPLIAVIRVARVIRALGFFGVLTLLLVWYIVGNLVTRMFPDGNALDAVITANAIGVLAALGYLAAWRTYFKKHFAKPS